ncbi:hypothetical protein like AT1G57700 [Hibiscus trionum]|uniref:Uncharacterized protein n=1 Tax=Hibiscus trionum TaxID=183268 RepID=A0A9W7J9L9_HIBTR|nr:hypothetical protein like AT1G57700 [Hibiscus trionum]
MGCICSKETQPDTYVEDYHEEKEGSKKLYVSPEVDNVAAETDTTPQQPNRNPRSDDEENKLASVVVETPKNTPPQLQRGLSLEALTRGGQGQQMRFSRIMSVTGGERGVQVVVGWPNWLVSVAGEAISGWIPSKADSYEKLEKGLYFVHRNFRVFLCMITLKLVSYMLAILVMIIQIGRGSYSSVYKARDVETNKIVALKKIRFTNLDPESIPFMAKENCR